MQQQEQENNIQQEEYQILRFQTLDGSFHQIKINENIRNRLQAFKNIDMESDILEMTKAPQFQKNVYENLQKYINVHKQDENKQIDQQLSEFSNRLQDIIDEKDYKIIQSLRRQDLIDLSRLAEFLMYTDLVDLLMKAILFHLAGKNNQEIVEWLEE